MEKKQLKDWEVRIENNKVNLRIGNQSFSILYDTEDVNDLEWMKEMLNIAISSLVDKEYEKGRKETIRLLTGCPPKLTNSVSGMKGVRSNNY